MTWLLRRMTARKEMEQQHKLQEEEIARLKQTHQTEIAKIRAECKEMQELHMQEVAQVARLACLSRSVSHRFHLAIMCGQHAMRAE